MPFHTADGCAQGAASEAHSHRLHRAIRCTFSSPNFFSPKKTPGKIRMARNYRRLNAGLTIQAANAQLATTFCVFLGHRIGGGYISPYEAEISAVRDFIQPHFKKEVRAFIGLINYYRRFIPHISTLSTPLTDLL